MNEKTSSNIYKIAFRVSIKEDQNKGLQSVNQRTIVKTCNRRFASICHKIHICIDNLCVLNKIKCVTQVTQHLYAYKLRTKSQ